MNTKLGLLTFISSSIVGGIFIGIWLVFLSMHYPNQEALFDFFTKPVAFEVPMSGYLALTFSMIASCTCFYFGKCLSTMRYRDD